MLQLPAVAGLTYCCKSTHPSPQNLNKKGDIMLIPDFSENKDNSMLLYFDAQGKDINSMYNELEKTYVCFEKMNQAIKDGKKYVVLEVKNDE